MRSVLTSLIAVGLVTGSLVGCSKKEEQKTDSKQSVLTQKSDAGILGNELLAKIPVSSSVFAVSDLGGPGYKALLASPWGEHYRSLDAFRKANIELEAQGAEAAKITSLLKAFLDAWQKLGLVSSDGKNQLEKVAKSVVVYLDASSPKPEAIDFGLFLSAAASTKMSEKLPIVETMFKENGIPTRREKLGSVDAVVATIVPQSGESPEMSLYVAASEEYLGLARSKASLERLFNPEVTDGLSVLSQTPEFKRATESVGFKGQPISFAYVSVKGLIPLVTAIQASSTEPSAKDFDIKTLPIDSIAGAQSISDKLTNDIVVAMTPRTETQKAVLAALDGASTPDVSTSVPKDVAFAIALDTKSLPKLLPLIEEAQGGEPLNANIDTLKNIQGTTIAMRKNDAGSPFPDLFISIAAENRESLSKMIEGAVSMGLAASGAGAEAVWQSKDIAGTPSKYMMTPLGVGLFAASPKDSKSLLLATSERALKDLIGAASASQASSPDLLKTFFNFTALADLLDGVKESLAMFGGQATGDFEKAVDTKAMRSWGTSAGSVGVKDGVLKVESDLIKPAA